MRNGSIYTCINMYDGKRYIGKSLQNLDVRKNKHLLDVKNGSLLYFHRAIRKFGEENFVWAVLENHVPEDKIDEKERFYINKYKTNIPKNGYNMTDGGEASYNATLSPLEVDNIKMMLRDSDLLMSEIGLKYSVNGSIISDINCGESYYSSADLYPIRKHKYSHDMTKKQVFEIYDLLRTGLSFKYIAEMYGVSSTNIQNLNRGLIHKYLKEEEYPLRARVFVHLDKQIIVTIVDMLKNTDYKVSRIVKLTGAKRETVKNLNNGYYHKDILKSLGIVNFPIRQFVTPKESIVNVINMIRETDHSMKKISDITGIGHGTITNINNGKSYVDISKECGITKFPIRKSKNKK